MNTSYKISYFDERRSSSAHGKCAVAAHIHDNILNTLDAVFMDAGSACEAIAWEMALGKRGHFTVMTNNMRAVRAFLTNRSIRIRITGGTYVVDDEALVGGGAVFDPDEFSAKYAIVGASALTATHVYNHGITGEEQIKPVYWQTPAQALLVPATLSKFGGKDACCFGELYREPAIDRLGNAPREVNPTVYDIFRQRVDEIRYSRRDAGASSLHRHAPRFLAEKCVIVIEPEWLIEKTFKDFQQRTALLQVVEDINRRSYDSGVEVVHATTTEERLQTSLRRLQLRGLAIQRSR